MTELELTHRPGRGLTSVSYTPEARDIAMANHQRLGFECQSWKFQMQGDWRWGFSYSFPYRITKAQKEEFERLRK